MNDAPDSPSSYAWYTGTGGVVSEMVDCIGRGHVKSGRKMRGIHDLRISGAQSIGSRWDKQVV